MIVNPRTRYQVALYDNRGVLYAIHDLIGSDQLRYSRKANGMGQFLMAIPAAQADPRMKQKDALAHVYRTNPLTGHLAPEQMYMLRYYDTVPGEASDAFVFEGYTPEHLLGRRVYDAEDDPDVANGYSTKGTNCATLMHEIVEEQCINPATHPLRAFPGLTRRSFLYDTSPYAAIRKETGDEYVLDILTGLAETYQVDFWIEFMGINTAGGYPKFEFNTGKLGEDWSKAAHPNGPYVYLTPSAGHLISPKLTIDAREEENAILVLGQGGNGNRLIYRKQAATVADSPFNYIEGTTQNNQTSDLDAYYTAADTALEEGKAKVTFEFEPMATAAGAIYEKDWDVGYVVTVAHRSVELIMRITEVEVTAMAGGEVIKVTADLWGALAFEDVDPQEIVVQPVSGGGAPQLDGGALSWDQINALWQKMNTINPKMARKLKEMFGTSSRQEITGAIERFFAATDVPVAGMPGRMVSVTADVGRGTDENVLMIDAGDTWRTPSVVHKTNTYVLTSDYIGPLSADWVVQDASNFKFSYTPLTSRTVIKATFTAKMQDNAANEAYVDIAYYDAGGAPPGYVRAGDTNYGLATVPIGQYTQVHLSAMFDGLTPGQSYTFYLMGKAGTAAALRYLKGLFKMWAVGD